MMAARCNISTRQVSAKATGEPLVVLHVFGIMDRGGAELRTLDLMRCLDRRQFRLIYGTLSGRAGELADEIRSLGGDVYSLGLTPRGALSFAKLVRKQRVDIVHSHVATFSGVVLLLAYLCGVPRRIAHFRSDGDQHVDRLRRRAQRFLMRKLLAVFATDVVAVSPAALEFAKGSGWRSRADLRVIPSGLNTQPCVTALTRSPLREVHALGASGKTVLHVGRSSPVKNRARAVSILGMLVSKGEDVHLLVAGSTTATETAELSALAAANNVKQRLHFVGQRADIAMLLRSVDMLLSTSTREGLPGVVLEAHGVGTPVVASALPGATWISEHLGGTELLELRRPDEDWAAAIACVLRSNVTLEDRRAALARLEASIFSMDNALIAFKQLWRQ